MLKFITVICIGVATLPVFSQSVSNYQVGTIMAVKPHQSASDNNDDAASYDVAVKVGDTIYLVLYKPPLGASPIKYAAGRNLLVVVNEKTLHYNNIVGESLEVPIISRKLATDANPSK